MQHRQTVVRYGHNNSSPSHLQRSGTSDLQRCCQTDDVVHAPLSSRNTSHVMNNRSLSVVSIYVQVISFCFYKLFSTVGPYPRVWPHDYRRVYGRMIPMGPFSVRGGIRRGGIRRAYTGVCPYGGYAPATFGVTGALFFELKKEKIRLSVPRALRAWHRSACRRMR